MLALEGGLAALLLASAVLPLAAGLIAVPLDAVAELLPVTLAAVAVAAATLVLRVVLVRRALRSRVRVELLPSEAFDPPVEAVVRFASQLARTRRMVLGWFDRPASTVRLCS